ncbi:MAG TPA: 6-phosphogluconolactonase [Verrucomicrobiae bacterium]|nr:6-phosphogluconolactonase [Verrucomicrobiae bacterium]
MRPRLSSAALRIDVAPGYESMSRRAEAWIVEELKNKPSLLLCASAGGTPTLLYELLAARARHEPRLFAQMGILQIDEWGGLPKAHPATCDADLREKLVEPLGIDARRYKAFATDAADPEKECHRISNWLSANGPIDICILGLGKNGHIAMNEPGEALMPRTHVARLTPSSLNHPMLQQLPRKPRYGLTLGMADILASRQILLLVNGTHKREAMKRLLRPQITTAFPASFLRLHSQAIVLCDRLAMPVRKSK